MVVFFYGGSWNSGDRREYGFVGRALAALGYVVVVPDHRLVPEVEYPLFLEDCAAAIAWVVAHIGEYGCDPDRLALVGHSAGAYNAAMMVLDPKYLAAQGLTDRVKGLVGLSGPYDFYPFDVAITLRVFGAAGDGEATQPIGKVTPAMPPALLATGHADRLVHPRHTVALAQKLRDAGVPVTEKHYPRTGHALPLLALGRPLRWSLPVFADVSAFLATTFASSSEGPPPAANVEERVLAPGE